MSAGREFVDWHRIMVSEPAQNMGVLADLMQRHRGDARIVAALADARWAMDRALRESRQRVAEQCAPWFEAPSDAGAIFSGRKP